METLTAALSTRLRPFNYLIIESPLRNGAIQEPVGRSSLMQLLDLIDRVRKAKNKMHFYGAWSEYESAPSRYSLARASGACRPIPLTRLIVSPVADIALQLSLRAISFWAFAACRLRARYVLVMHLCALVIDQCSGHDGALEPSRDSLIRHYVGKLWI